MPQELAYPALLEEVRARQPRIALVLGSGLQDVVERLAQGVSVHFGHLPGMPAASVEGHRGRLTLGDWVDQPVLLFEGRIHSYEGHPWRTVLQPVTLAHDLGAKILLATNSCGGIRPDLGPCSLMALTDHIDCTRPRSWMLPGPGGLGGPRPSPYSPRLLQILQQAAEDRHIPLATGIYAQMLGPCYETPAEGQAMKAWGADAVGMSTGREIEAAHQLGLECAAVSCITNRATGLGGEKLSHEEVKLNAGLTADRLGRLIERFLEKLNGRL